MIKLGNTKIVGLYKGEAKIKRIYKGNIQIHSEIKPEETTNSYIIYGCSKKISDQAFEEGTGLQVVSHDATGEGNRFKVVFDGKATQINDNFLRFDQVNSIITYIKFYNFEELESIGNYFLYEQQSIFNSDCIPVSNATSIGDYFLYHLINFDQLDLSGLSNVRSVGNYFLAMVYNITEIDLMPLSNLTTIGSHFLYKCSKITELDLTGLSNVATIGNYFIDECTKLKTYIVNNPEKAVVKPLQECWSIPTKIYVNDEFIEQYKKAVPDFANLFAPLSTKL